MRIGIYGAALGAMQQEKAMDVLANNLANAATPGFKKETVHFVDAIRQSTHTQMSQGRLQTTGNPLDIAVVGEGFLRVQSNQGVLYTRAGNLTVNADKIIVTREGWPVLGQNGPIRVEHSDVRIEKNGQVFDKGDKEGDEENMVGALEVVKFSPTVEMEKAGGGYLKPAGGEDPLPAEGYTVEQGFLEESNSGVMEEMTRMIETSRLFEAYQKAIQVFEQEEAQLINKLGNVNS
ncbi:MAG: flagellar hook basal-body protein [Syntrophobacteraceae bacterium]|nr:flagellar hook basal-body protein [Syntrophobacteraceae bacterium]